MFKGTRATLAHTPPPRVVAGFRLKWIWHAVTPSPSLPSVSAAAGPLSIPAPTLDNWPTKAGRGEAGLSPQIAPGPRLSRKEAEDGGTLRRQRLNPRQECFESICGLFQVRRTPALFSERRFLSRVLDSFCCRPVQTRGGNVSVRRVWRRGKNKMMSCSSGQNQQLASARRPNLRSSDREEQTHS